LVNWNAYLTADLVVWPFQEVVPILNASFHPDTFAHGIAPFIRDFVVGTGRVLAGEADGWLAECVALDAAGEFFASLNRYLFVLRRPG